MEPEELQEEAHQHQKGHLIVPVAQLAKVNLSRRLRLLLTSHVVEIGVDWIDESR